ncbi:glycosyltransferase family 2 protein [Pseudoclavibacter soli]|uniref:glycosyltransferase family 2 protein n=1 Tax=Pseudoclavibacter soli TaxID=452623 RepID=UPI00040BAF84|nr:glycosyltransferase family 2 protein [Pseudoclavibacter soli]
MSTVSVIIRTFDRPEFLQRALEDLSRQIRLPDEVIIVNDGGDSQLITPLIEASDLQTTLISNDKRLGGPKAGNIGVRAAQSDYLVLHDDDDTWHPDFLLATTKWLDTHPEQPAIVTPIDIVYERRESEHAPYTEYSRMAFEPGHAEFTLFDLLKTNRFTPIGLVYRRSIHDEMGYYDETLPVVDDWDFHMRLASHSPIPVLPGPALAFWRQRPDATGAESNSVFAAHEAHRRFDLLRRDVALRSDPAGLGGLLYLTRFIDDRFQELTDRITAQQRAYDAHVDQLRRALEERNSQLANVEEAISDASVVSLIRRRWRRFRHR